MTRINEETKVRDYNDDSGYTIPATFYKNFTWNRTYNVRWEIMRSLSMDYSATNISRVDEPYGRINTAEKRDSLWNRIATFGHNTSYVQTFNSSYNVPLAKLPLTDWMNLRLGYNANYSWTGAAPVAYELGNTLGNTQTKTVTGELNMTQLYNKSRWLKALNNPRSKTKKTEETKPSSNSIVASNVKKTEKDLRKPGDKKSIDLNPTEKNPGADPGAGSKDKTTAGNKNQDTPGKQDSTGKAPNVNKNDKDNKNQDNEKDDDKVTDPKIEKYGSILKNVNTANMSDQQIDSLVKVLKAQEKAKLAAEKAKKKAERKAARKARRSKLPELSTISILSH